MRLGHNAHAILGGVRLWDDKKERGKRRTATASPLGTAPAKSQEARSRPAAGSPSGDAEGEAEVPSAS